MTDRDGDLPGLEPDPPSGSPPTAEIPTVHSIEPTTYLGWTNAELDRWFDEVYGGQDRFEREYRDDLARIRAQEDPARLLPHRDPDVAATLAGIEGLLTGTSAFESLVITDWHRLGGDLKARFRRGVGRASESTTPPGKEIVIIGSAVAAVTLGALLWFGVDGGSDSPPTTVDDVATTLADDDAATTTEPDSPPTTLAEGADATDDVFGSPGIVAEDSAEVAASDIVATSYVLDGGSHVFQMKVRGDGAALAGGDVRWYNPRFVIQTAQGEFTLDVDAVAGTARLIDGPFTDAPQIEAEVVWLEPGCLQVAATIIGLTDEATSFRTELSVRLADGTDYSDDASFGG